MSRWTLSALIAMAPALAGAPPGASPVRGPQAPTQPADPVRRIREIGIRLPRVLTSLTPRQEALAVEGCRLYRRLEKRFEELDPKTRGNLLLLGIRSGSAAGEPEVMFSAAKRYWRSLPVEKRGEYAAYVLAWAGILAGRPAEAKEALNHLIARPPTPARAAWARGMLPIAEDCAKPVKLRFQLLDGKHVDLADLRGKAVVLDFWATWSQASLRQREHLRSFYRQRRGDGRFYMVSLSLDATVEQARRGAAKAAMTWPQAMDRGARGRFRGKGVPHVVVLSARGRVIWQGHPAERTTLAWTTDFARRQGARMAERARSDGPASAPATAAPAGPRASPPQQAVSDARAAEADRKYKVARSYWKMGLRDRCRAILREIVQKYPRTPAAEKARAFLRAAR